jgi:hypothetical protein
MFSNELHLALMGRNHISHAQAYGDELKLLIKATGDLKGFWNCVVVIAQQAPTEPLQIRPQGVWGRAVDDP